MQVVDGMVPARLEDASISGKYWQVAPGRVLLYAPACVGRFLVEDGRQVTLQRSADAQEDVLAVQFLDSAMAMVLMQRGYAVLHANAAVTPTGAVAISGESGAARPPRFLHYWRVGVPCSPMISRHCTSVRMAWWR